MSESTSTSGSGPSVLRVAAGADRFGEHRPLGISEIAFKVTPQDSGGLLILENTFHAKGGPAYHGQVVAPVADRHDPGRPQTLEKPQLFLPGLDQLDFDREAVKGGYRLSEGIGRGDNDRESTAERPQPGGDSRVKCAVLG